MKIAVIIASRGRPESAAAVFLSAHHLASDNRRIDYLLACDDDDDATLAYGFPAWVTISTEPRPSGPGACWNRCVGLTDADVIVALGDDGLIATVGWDDIIVRHLHGVDPRVAVLSWHNNISPNQPTVPVMHRQWIERAGLFDERFPFWFSDTAIAETYSFVTGRYLQSCLDLHIISKTGFNPRLRDMGLWWALYAETRNDRLATAAKMRAEIGLREPPNLADIVEGWQRRDAVGLPASEAIVRSLPPRKPDERYIAAKTNAEGILAQTRKTICLSMIVKNEAHVIRRCLDSVRPLIDRWCIVDTGSTDGTQDIIREHMEDMSGELHERPWVDFATNRTEAIELARPHADYSFIIDADDTLEIPAGFVMPRLTSPGYTVSISFNSLAYSRPQLISNAHPWRYRGVLHEFLEGASADHHMPGLVIKVGNDGARRSDPTKYAKDAAVIEEALKTEEDPFLIARYEFYLAQSYRDAGMPEKAIEHYQKRATLGFWQEEVYISLLNAARLMQNIERPLQLVESAYQFAADANRARAEAHHDLARYLRLKNDFKEATKAAERGLAIPMPHDGLFLEPWVYQYGLLDEFAVSAYYCDRFGESAIACERILREGNAPEDVCVRVRTNLDFARKAIERDEVARRAA